MHSKPDASFTGVISLGCSLASPHPNTLGFPHLEDMEDAFLMGVLPQAVDFLQTNTKVLVHCVAGRSRSAAVCVAFVMVHHQCGFKKAYKLVQQARPVVEINPGFRLQLCVFGHVLRESPGALALSRALRYQCRCARTLRRGGKLGARKLEQADVQAPFYKCKQCRVCLFGQNNLVLELGPVQEASSYQVEPLEWMFEGEDAKVKCFQCGAKLGSMIKDSFFVVKSKVDAPMSV